LSNGSYGRKGRRKDQLLGIKLGRGGRIKQIKRRRRRRRRRR